MRTTNHVILAVIIGMSWLLPLEAIAENSIANVFAGLRTRANCVEELKGLGNGSLIFAHSISRNYTEDNSMNGEFSWDAILIVPGSAPVNVTLHCVRVKLPAIEGISDEPWTASFAELVKKK